MELTRARRTRRGAALGLLALAVAACGTTVPVEQQGAGAALVGEQLSGAVAGPTQQDDVAPAGPAGAAGPGVEAAAGTTPGSTGAADPDVQSGTGRSADGGAGSATGPARPPGTAGSPRSTRTAAGSAPVTGAARDTTPLKVAVFYLNGGNRVLSSAFPGSSVSFGDGKREAQAIIDDVNARGLAGGRKLLPSFIEVQATDNDAGRQQACLGAVQDVRPVAVFAMFNLSAGLARCVQQTGTLMIDVALGAGDEELYAQAKNLAFSPSQITRDAEQELVLAVARKEGRLPAGKPVGIVAQSDDPMYLRVSRNAIQPTLRALGVPFIEQQISSASDSSGMNAAVLRFKSSGVDTVVFSTGSGGIPPVLFMQSAEQQQFRPAYLMGDSTNTNFVSSQAPRAQAERISGAGTYPLANVPADQYPSTPNEKKCLDLLNKRIGGYTDRYSSLTGTLYCEIIYSFAHVANRIPGRVTSRSWSEAYYAAGGSYAPVTTFATRFRPGRPDGASRYRSLAYKASCRCVSYTSPAIEIP